MQKTDKQTLVEVNRYKATISHSSFLLAFHLGPWCLPLDKKSSQLTINGSIAN